MSTIEATPRNSRQRPSAGMKPGSRVNTFWLDESGSKQTAGKCYTVAGLKVREPDDLQREIKVLRDRHSFTGEFKYTRISSGNSKVINELIDLLGESDIRLIATVSDHTFNPFKERKAWEAQAEVVAQLVLGNLNRDEVGVVMMDAISTPPGYSVGNRVKRLVNSRLRNTSVVTAISLNSEANDLLQAADLIAGAIRNQRVDGKRGSAVSPEKRQASRRLAAAFDLDDFGDVRNRRVNIATLKGPWSGSASRTRPASRNRSDR